MFPGAFPIPRPGSLPERMVAGQLLGDRLQGIIHRGPFGKAQSIGQRLGRIVTRPTNTICKFNTVQLPGTPIEGWERRKPLRSF